MAGFAKLFGSIVTSSIWCQDHKVLRIWIAMLATCDSDGIVEGSVPGFASLCRVSIDDLEIALEVLTGPDPHSRTPDNEGRRVQVVPGGWKILNYKIYRDRGQAKEGSRAPYMRTRRAHKSDPELPDAPDCNALQNGATGYTEAEYRVQSTEKDKEQRPAPSAPASTPSGKKPRKIQTTALKSDSQKAFEAIWSTPPKTFSRWSAEEKTWLDEPVPKGSRMEGERAFQALVDAQVETPRVLYAAFHAYITEAEGPKKGFFQAVSTFFGPKKATYLEWLDRGRQLAKETA